MNAALLLLFINSVAASDYFVYNCPRPNDDKFYNIPLSTIEVTPRSSDGENEDVLKNYLFTYKMSYVEGGASKSMDVAPFLQKSPFDHLVIPPNKLKVELDYKIEVTHEAKPGHSGPKIILASKNQTCLLKIRDLPIAYINGGSFKTLRANTYFHIVANQSMSAPEGDPYNDRLTHDWKCKQKLNNTICSYKVPPSKRDWFFSVATTYTQDGEEFKFEVIVTKKDRKFSSTAKQTIVMVTNCTHHNVRCVENCFPYYHASDFQLKTVLEVDCFQYCEEVNEKDYYWTVKWNQFDYSKASARTGPRFEIKPNAFSPGVYEVEVKLKNTRCVNAFQLTYKNKPKYGDCYFEPPNGTEHETKFVPHCRSLEKWDMNDMYEILARETAEPKNQSVVSTAIWRSDNRRSTMLPPSKRKQFFIKFYRSYATSSEFPIKVDEVIKKKINTTLEQDLEFLKEDFGDMIASKDPDERQAARDRLIETVDKINVSAIDAKLSDLFNKLKYVIPENVLDLPVNSLSEAAKVVLAVVKVESINQDANSDPQLGKVITTACRKVGDRAFELMGEKKDEPGMKELATTLNKALTECLESGARSDNEQLHHHGDLDATTPEPNVDDSDPTELYDNYVDHDSAYYKYLEDMKESTHNMLNGTAMAAKMKAFTIIVGEGPVETIGEITKTVILKDTGANLLKTPVKVEGVRVVPSEDFANDSHSYDILLSSWSKDIMWWNPAGTKVATNIINLQFWHSVCKARVSEFKKPVDVFLSTKNETFDEEVTEYSFMIPKGYSGMSDGDLNYHIQVHRVGLEQGQRLSVKFHDLSQDDELHVIFTVNKFPCVEDFKNSTSIRQDLSVITLLNEKSYSTFTYVGIMANKTKAVEGKTVTYRISTVLTTCIKWITLDSKWKTDCNLKEVNYTAGNTTVLHCQCWNLSVIAGYIQNMKSPRQTLIKPDWELEMTRCLVIFYTLVVTMSVYFILLIFAVVKRKEPIYFLADNNVKHQFAYIVTIKTGWSRTSGTSSNIMIRVFGSKAASEPHVLNYPDPKMRLLQRFGNEKYLLTTGNHLGNLERIELWFDAIGQNPFWFCKDIKIYDMQLRKEWFFKVNRRLSLTHGSPFIVVEPEQTLGVSDDEPPMRSKSVTRPKSFYRLPSSMHLEAQHYTFMHRTHNWYFWHLEDHFSYFKKLTIVLSNILTDYSIAIMYVAPPEMELRDGFDRYYYEGFGTREFLYAIASSFPVFLSHLIIGWVFRVSRLQFDDGRQDGLWPFFSTAICWAVTVILIVASLTHLLIVGFWIPCYTSLVWLTISLVGMVTGIFVYESIFAFVQTVCCTVNEETIQKNFVTIWKTADIQRKYLYSRFGEPLLRPYFEHLYHPLKRRMIREKTRFLSIRMSVISEFEDLFMFGVYVVILYMVILSEKDSRVVYGQKNMVAMIRGEHLRTMHFDDVQSIDDLYYYLNNTFIPAMHPLFWYGNYVISSPGMMTDLRTKFLGVVRIRQQRVHRMKHHCETVQAMKFLNMTCWPEFSMRYAESEKYGYRWGAFTSLMVYDRMRSMWEYTYESTSDTHAVIGAIAVYSGGGYIAFLGRMLYNSYANLKKIAAQWWIDEDSKVIFIEFMAYNADYNIFDAVRLTFEQSSTDYFQSNMMVYTARMLMVDFKEEKMRSAFFYLFIVWVGLLLFKSSIGAIRHMRSFITNLWMLIDTFIIIMSVLCIVLFGLRMLAIDNYLDALEEVRNNQFVSYFHLFDIEDFLTVAAAILVCIATIRLWKFLRFSRMFRTLERTLLITGKIFVCFFSAFLVVLVATSMALLLIVGHEFYRMHTLVKMIRLLATFALRAVEFKAVELLPFETAMVYLVFFTIFELMSMMVLTMLVVWSYSEAQRQFSGKQDIYTIKDYIMERCGYFVKLCRYRCFQARGGQSHTQIQIKIEPKDDKFLYTNSHLCRTRRMILMEYLTHCLLRKTIIKKCKEFDDYDQNLILLICRRYLVKTEDYNDVEVFFKGRFAGKRIEFIDEKHLDLISNVVNLILQDEEVVFEKAERNVEVDECAMVVQRGQNTLRRSVLNLKLLYHQIKAAEVEIGRLHLEKH